MKKLVKFLLTGMCLALCPMAANAQIIYSNSFSGGAVNIARTAPNVANSFAGGTNTATWNDVLGTNNPAALLANGTQTTTLGDSYLLPFSPQSGYIYLLSATVTFTNNPNNWIGIGFALNDTTNVTNGFARFSDNETGGTNSPRGYDWPILTESTGNVQWFAGAGTATTLYSANNAFTPGFRTNSVSVTLNTLSSLWSISLFVDGVQLGTNYTYPSNPTIRGVGITQNAVTLPTAIQWNSLSLSSTFLPFITRQPTSQGVSLGSVYSNSVVAVDNTNGGPLVYQWYDNGVPISGATSNILIINPVTSASAGTNYVVVINNNYGSVTSAPVSLTVYTNPIITAVIPTNVLTIFGGTSTGGTNYFGSSPTLALSAVGALPLSYLWETNGFVEAVTTNAFFTFTNCQFNNPTTLSGVVSNSFGETTNTWTPTYLATPTAPYPQAVLSAIPFDFFRLNESSGSVCYDYQSGRNGVYSNVSLGQTGYNSSEPTETSVGFGLGGVTSSYIGQISNVDFAVSAGTNAEFTVEAWANCFSGGGSTGGAPVVTKGVFGVSDAFALGVDTNSSSQHYQFYVRSASGTVYTADSTVIATDLNWHHLVGVCDEANGQVSLYVDGGLAASVSIPAGAGSYEVSAPVSIGAGMKSGSTTYNLQFSGYIADVATYKYALSAPQVASEYISAEGALAPMFSQTPPSSITVNAGATLTIPAALVGSAPLGYYWTDVNGGTNIASGSTNGSSINATLTYVGVPANWNGDQLELTATNSAGSTNFFVTLTVLSGAPQILTNIQNPFGGPLGGTITNSIVIAGTAPFGYQWQSNGVNLTNNGRITGTMSSVLTIANAQLSDQANYRVIVTNSFGSVTSIVATLVIENKLPLSFDGGLGWSGQQTGNYTVPIFTNGVVTLTDGTDDEARSYFFNYPQYIGAFKASFIYQAAAPAGYTNLLADGFSFCLQNSANGASALGGIGGSIGVGVNGATAAITPSVELECDIYPSNGIGGIGFAFQTNGAFGPYTSPGTVPLTNGPVAISLYYVSGQLALTFSNINTAATFSTNLLVGNLATLLNSNTAYVGFTGGSGGDPAIQTITNFSFVSIPTITIQVTNNTAVITSPGSIVGYTLQETTNLAMPNWMNVPNQGTLTNGVFQTTAPVTGTAEFFRLVLQP